MTGSAAPLGFAVDSSVAVPVMMQNHDFHDVAVRWMGRRYVSLAGHAAAETYSVVTRLPGDARLLPRDAVRLMDEWFGHTALLDAASAQDLPRTLAEAGVAGAAVFDAMVGLAARENDLILATRDGRAGRTYEALGVRFELVA